MKFLLKISLGITVGVSLSLILTLIPFWILIKYYLVAQQTNFINFSSAFELYMSMAIGSIFFARFLVVPIGIIIGITIGLGLVLENKRLPSIASCIPGGVLGFKVGLLMEIIMVSISGLSGGPQIQSYFFIVSVMTVGLALTGVVTNLVIHSLSEFYRGSIPNQA